MTEKSTENTQAKGQIHVCGVTCHKGDANCNGYCIDARVPHAKLIEVSPEEALITADCDDQTTLLLIQRVISDLSVYGQKRVKQSADKLKATIKQDGSYGEIALALVAAEAAVEADKNLFKK